MVNADGRFPTRRTVIRQVASGLLAGVSAGLPLFAASDFWNRKPAANWSPGEIEKLMTKSPWARQVSIGASPDRPGGAVPDPVLEGIPGMAGGSVAGPPGPGSMPSYPQVSPEEAHRGARRAGIATIRWESAQPMLDATKETFPKEFAGHYVIAVAGLPVEWGLAPERGRHHAAQATDETVRLSDLIDRLKAGATLEAKGREPEGAGVVKRSPSDEAWLFGFSKDLLPLSSADRDVDFNLAAGPMVIRARFSPKEMIYKGQVAL